jgi:hypothetical protein
VGAGTGRLAEYVARLAGSRRAIAGELESLRDEQGIALRRHTIFAVGRKAN